MACLHTLLFNLNGLGHPEILLKRIREGDDKALFNFAKVDKTIVTHKYARRRIRLAQISGDHKFLRRLGNAIAYDPRKRPFKFHRRNYFMGMIAILATEHLTINEVDEILREACDHVEPDLDTLRKAWNRAGLHKIAP